MKKTSVDITEFHRQKSSLKAPEKNSVGMFALVLVLIGLSLIFNWTQSYTLGQASGIEAGIIQGESTGKDLGTVNGHEVGYIDGHEGGYDDGFILGYEEGNDEGYILGYEEGNIEGYVSGYEEGTFNGITDGYEDGFSQGYNNGFVEGNSTGFEITFNEGFSDIENRRFNVTDVSFDEVKRFLRSDRTDAKTYWGQFNCHDYTRAVKENAFKKGIRSYYVSIDFVEPPGHAIIAFNTTDRGLVFFEPQSDKEMEFGIGVRYWRDNVRRSRPGYDDTVVNYVLIG